MADYAVGHQVTVCRQALKESGITDTPALEARLLIEHATSLSQAQQITKAEKILSEEEYLRIQELLVERLQGRPMAYILGSKEFYGRSFLVDERVLIPRPDTETLVELALGFAKGHKEKLNIVDVCTGSGCIGISLACELGYAVHLTDISLDALSVAQTNAKRLFGRELPTSHGNLLCPLSDNYDIIVSNPPYLTTQWWDEVDQQVKREPRLALEDSGPDGLSLIRTLIEQSVTHLHPGGALMIECDYRQVDALTKDMIKAGFSQVRSERDLAGKERVVWGIYTCTNN